MQRQTSSSQDRVIIISNFYQFNIEGREMTPKSQLSQFKLHQYKLQVTPKVDKDKMFKIRQELVFGGSEVTQKLGKTVKFAYTESQNGSPFIVNSIYNNEQNFKFEATASGRQYDVSVSYQKDIGVAEEEFLSFFYEVVQQNMMKEIQENIMRDIDHFKQFKRLDSRSIYCPEQMKHLKAHDIEIWPGFKYEVKRVDGVPMLNIDLSYQVVRQETVLDLINDLKKQQYDKDIINDDRLQQDLRKLLVGKVVVTRYNNCLYWVSDIDFSQTPNSIFQQKILDQETGRKKMVKKSYVEYLNEKYSKMVQDKDQPIIISSLGYGLVPEFCLITDLSEEIMAQPHKFNLIREVISMTQPEAQRRIVDIKRKFLDKQNSDSEIKLSMEPYLAHGIKLQQGSLQMAKLPQGPRIEIQINPSDDLEKKIFSTTPLRMFEQPPLETWAIICLEEDEKSLKSFKEQFYASLQIFNYHHKEPRIIMVKDKSFQEWDRTLRECLETHYQLCLIILPGVRGQSNPLYDDIKKMLLIDVPIPSQIILTSTIRESRSALFSICNKMLFQICAKTGGEPWALNELPFFDDCSIAIGYYVTDDYISLVSTLNSKATRYWCKSMSLGKNPKEQSNALLQCLQKLLFEMLLAFKYRINCLPRMMFIYTNSRQNKMKDLSEIKKELNCFLSLIKKMELQCKIIFTLVNPNVSQIVRFGISDPPNRIEALQQGIVVPETKYFEQKLSVPYSFYLVSHYNKDLVQAFPSLYEVIYDDICLQNYLEVLEFQKQNLVLDYFVLTQRLCFLYYNYIGGILMPAPLKYAQKLTNQVKELSECNRKQEDHIQIHEHFDKSILGLFQL